MMKFPTIASLLLLQQASGQSTSCPSDLTQSLSITDSLTLYYDVVGDIFCARMESQSDGYLGFGISPTGGMYPADAVIGLPDDGTVLLYDMTAESTSGVVAMPDNMQTLTDTSIVQGGGVTTMTFARKLDEGSYPLVVGDNPCIYAQSTSNAFGYHGSGRGAFQLTLESTSDSNATATTTAAPSGGATLSGTTPASAESITPAPTVATQVSEPASDPSSGYGARNIGTFVASAGVVAAWFGM
ncbi:hypothetical protein HJC23_013509 [Cyclotella cryptica]|uniref:DOMON domain-containing protein n=1 Tax=Cyclotella cryptica TaxID=29204 RepID=A0ABD3QC71_9STRA|eukprot:CCRYP_006956-RA/>CCRYP_006956-RA protein AED:0.15 eAED:0.15 QI:0/-1/0/1/-1/1/1/0/241